MTRHRATAEPVGQARPVRIDPRPVLRLGPAVTLPVRPRSLLLALILVLATLLAGAATLSLGRLGVPLSDLFAAFTGRLDAQTAFALERLRGPRLVVAIGTGIALGMAGALFQSVARNPLGSPDVIGVGAGAGAGAAFFALLVPGLLPASVGAVVGGAAAVLLVYVSTGTGFREPGRLIIAGIAVAAMATAFTHYVVFVVARDRASVLAAYLNGSLSARSWEHAATIGIALAVTVPFVAVLAGRIAVTEMGDELADGFGARPQATRAWAVVLSVVLSGAAVSVAGPISFIALTAPNIAKRLSRSPGPNLALSGLTGALLLVLADLIAQHSPLGDGLPVGIFTMGIGGLYLGLLLIREWRKGTL
ncbi:MULTISPECIES: FecCD family ABC transporter permease [Actinoalloteichus]|uniref:ABC-type enterobactin transport system, permease component n=1 Tax=Actinoalloteichus fjordicus TaxID=1612552 RepID=A0AAC9LBL3_9PSEU|nr:MULTISPECIES: iron chelate uptake ABC transporter family permease subunit [Actinoalloteichus]APU14943.1 ABC-type enterobactin transport system, permease component [Actinoalloteichus fjordicus]APU21013.1 ABC-type enterobactin transport system, permease component [Actinoalloteichus sp. GBA129-24]